ncbi:EndoU domain-containing protein [Nocardia sp. NPDC055321]
MSNPFIQDAGPPSWVAPRSAAWNLMTASGLAQQESAPGVSGSGRTIDLTVKDGVAAARQYARIRNVEALTQNPPVTAQLIGLTMSPDAVGGPAGPVPHVPMRQDNEQLPVTQGGPAAPSTTLPVPSNPQPQLPNSQPAPQNPNAAPDQNTKLVADGPIPGGPDQVPQPVVKAPPVVPRVEGQPWVSGPNQSSMVVEGTGGQTIDTTTFDKDGNPVEQVRAVSDGEGGATVWVAHADGSHSVTYIAPDGTQDSYRVPPGGDLVTGATSHTVGDGKGNWKTLGQNPNGTPSLTITEKQPDGLTYYVTEFVPGVGTTTNAIRPGSPEFSAPWLVGRTGIDGAGWLSYTDGSTKYIRPDGSSYIEGQPVRYVTFKPGTDPVKIDPSVLPASIITPQNTFRTGKDGYGFDYSSLQLAADLETIGKGPQPWVGPDNPYDLAVARLASARYTTEEQRNDLLWAFYDTTSYEQKVQQAQAIQRLAQIGIQPYADPSIKDYVLARETLDRLTDPSQPPRNTQPPPERPKTPSFGDVLYDVFVDPAVVLWQAMNGEGNHSAGEVALAAAEFGFNASMVFMVPGAGAAARIGIGAIGSAARATRLVEALSSVRNAYDAARIGRQFGVQHLIDDASRFAAQRQRIPSSHIGAPNPASKPFELGPGISVNPSISRTPKIVELPASPKPNVPLPANSGLVLENSAAKVAAAQRSSTVSTTAAAMRAAHITTPIPIASNPAAGPTGLVSGGIIHTLNGIVQAIGRIGRSVPLPSVAAVGVPGRFADAAQPIGAALFHSRWRPPRGVRVPGRLEGDYKWVSGHRTKAKSETTPRRGTPPPSSSPPPLSANEHTWSHVIRGEISKDGKAKGYHLRPDGKDRFGIKTTNLTAKDENGVYRGTVNMTARYGSEVTIKTRRSSFFPDSWSTTRVQIAIEEAVQKAVVHADGSWQGWYRGIEINGYYDTGTGLVKTAYPIFKGVE